MSLSRALPLFGVSEVGFFLGRERGNNLYERSGALFTMIKVEYLRERWVCVCEDSVERKKIGN